jgi:hypothetical protein
VILFIFAKITISKRDENLRLSCCDNQRIVSLAAAGYMNKMSLKPGDKYDVASMLESMEMSDPNYFKCRGGGNYTWTTDMPDLFTGELIMKCSIKGHQLPNSQKIWIKAKH